MHKWTGIGLVGNRCIKVNVSLSPRHALALDEFARATKVNRSEALRRRLDLAEGNAASFRAALRPELAILATAIDKLLERRRAPGEAQAIRDAMEALHRLRQFTGTTFGGSGGSGQG